MNTPLVRRSLFLSTTLVLALTITTGCGRKGDGHDHSAHAAHAHAAPHGGALVELGEHQFNLEIVVDPTAGKLSLYVLDGHAESFVRVNQSTLTVTAKVGGESRTLTLAPVASVATGETATDTSVFEGQADWLKTTPAFEAVLTKIEVRGNAFQNVAFSFPKPAQE